MRNKSNGEILRELIEGRGYTQPAALALYNVGQAKPMSLRALKTYLASPDSATWVACPDGVLNRMKKVLK